MRLVHIALAASLLASPALAAPAACPVKEITNHGDFLSFGGYSMHLLGGDGDPTAWEGPMTVTSASGKTCSAELSIISPPFFAAGSHYLYVTTYSGSQSYQDLIDLRDCSDKWHKDDVFVGSPQFVKGDTFIYREAAPVKIGPDCLPEVPAAASASK